MRKYDIINACWDADCTSAEKLVLLCLAHHYNVKTQQCNPSYERMAKMTGLCRRSITKAMRGLRDKGLIGAIKTKLTLQCSLYVYRHHVPSIQAPDAQHGNENGVWSSDQMDDPEINKRLRAEHKREIMEPVQ